jgi:hypothetical protein
MLMRGKHLAKMRGQTNSLAKAAHFKKLVDKCKRYVSVPIVVINRNRRSAGAPVTPDCARTPSAQRGRMEFVTQQFVTMTANKEIETAMSSATPPLGRLVNAGLGTIQAHFRH